MARLRKFAAYRSLERPYTRISKFRKKAFIKANPPKRIVAFETGNRSKKFAHTLQLVSKGPLQIRGNALESARLSANRFMERTIGNQLYKLKLKPYPHHVLRENPLASGAGADRFSTGMKKSFGKPIGVAVQLRPGQTVFEISVDAANKETAKTALERASKKLPSSYAIEVVDNE